MKILKSQLKQLVEEVLSERHDDDQKNDLIEKVFELIKKYGHTVPGKAIWVQKYRNISTPHLKIGDDFTDSDVTFD